MASATDSPVLQRAHEFLHEARDVALRWTNELSTKLQRTTADAQILDYQRRVCEMAAICRSTYDVDPEHVPVLLSTPGALSTFITCSITIFDNQPPMFSSAPADLRTLLSRDRRLGHKYLQPVLKALKQDPQLLNLPVRQIWPEYHASAFGWTTLSLAGSRWVSTMTLKPHRGVAQQVSLNLLEGQFLIDGKPMGRLPHD
jgi:hypothetical protein